MTIQELHVSTSDGSQISTGNDPQVSTNNEPSVNIEPQTTGAADGTAEDTPEEYKALVEQLMEQNKSLIEQNKSLQTQFGILIRSGAHVGRNGDSGSVSDSGSAGFVQDMGQNEPQEPYVSLAELGKEIGKRDYGSHNTQKE